MSKIETINEVIDYIQNVRHEFLNRIIKESASINDYSQIIEFFRASHPINPYQRIYEIQPTLNNDIFLLSSNELQKKVILQLYTYFEENPHEFNIICPEAQYIIWNEIFSCVENLMQIKKELINTQIQQKKNNFPDSCNFVHLHLHRLARAYCQIVILENQLGIERYLATSGLDYDIKLIHSLVKDIRRESNEKLNSTKLEFQKQWNLTAISRIIRKLLGDEILDDSVTCNFPRDQNRVIFILIDGMGYAQYLWYREGIKNQKNATYGINIFEWLSQFDEYNDSYVLGSTLITDTGSAIASIYSGKLPSYHGIYASNMYNGEESVNIKKIDGEKFDKFVEICPDTFLSNLTNVEIKILDGSGSYTKKNKNSFTKFIFADFPRDRIVPENRLFKKISHSIENVSNNLLILGYYPLIDNTSHSIGSFTSFESSEYEKLNIMLVDMLIDLAKNQPFVFDGKTTILISADHGMFEISSKKITLSEIKKLFQEKMAIKTSITINARSIFIYKIPQHLIKKGIKLLNEFIEERDIIANIYSKNDEIIQDLLFSSERFGLIPIPDIILLFEDEGIGVTNDIDDTLIFHGSHGGSSCEEVFIPLIQIRLTEKLRSEIMDHFAKIS